VLSLSPAVRVFIVVEAFDMRGSFDSAAGAVRRLGLDPVDGHLYLFLNKRRRLAKALWFDGSGWCLLAKRLEAGSFQLPVMALARAVRFDGTAWGTPFLAESPSEPLTVFSVSPTDLWAVSRSTSRWNGTDFRTVSLGSSGNDTADVWAASTDVAFLVGNPCGASRYLLSTGNASCIPGGTISGITGVWSSSATDVWWVGTALYRWNGTALSTTARPANVNPLTDVHGASASEVWAVGQSGSMARFNGATWARIGAGVTSSTLNGVYVASPTSVFVVGTAGARYRFDGATWTNDSLMAGPTFNAVHGIGGNEVWAVGAGGVIHRFNGTSWSTLASGTTATLVAVRSASDVLISGPAGEVERRGLHARADPPTDERRALGDERRRVRRWRERGAATNAVSRATGRLPCAAAPSRGRTLTAW
jgi:transposase